MRRGASSSLLHTLCYFLQTAKKHFFAQMKKMDNKKLPIEKITVGAILDHALPGSNVAMLAWVFDKNDISLTNLSKYDEKRALKYLRDSGQLSREIHAGRIFEFNDILSKYRREIVKPHTYGQLRDNDTSRFDYEVNQYQNREQDRAVVTESGRIMTFPYYMNSDVNQRNTRELLGFDNNSETMGLRAPAWRNAPDTAVVPAPAPGSFN